MAVGRRSRAARWSWSHPGSTSTLCPLAADTAASSSTGGRARRGVVERAARRRSARSAGRLRRRARSSRSRSLDVRRMGPPTAVSGEPRPGSSTAVSIGCGLDREFARGRRLARRSGGLRRTSTRLVELSRRRKELEPIVERTAELRPRTGRPADRPRDAAPSCSGDDREQMRAEVDELEARIAELEDELRVLLLPARPQRRPQRDRRDPRCRGRRGGQPLRPRPLRDVPRLRAAHGLEVRGPVERRRRTSAATARSRSSSGATASGHG